MSEREERIIYDIEKINRIATILASNVLESINKLSDELYIAKREPYAVVQRVADILIEFLNESDVEVRFVELPIGSDNITVFGDWKNGKKNNKKD